MKAAEIQELYDYSYWATHRILAAAGQVSREQFVARADLSHGGLRGTLVHTLGAEWIWRMRFQEGVSPTALLAETDFPTVEALAARWQAEEQAMRGYLAGLSDDDLAKTISYRRTGGSPQENVLWHLLVHVANHGTQHRSESAVLLTDYGHSPGDLDFIIYLRQRRG